MSATTERLVEEINELEQRIAALPSGSGAARTLREELDQRRKELTAATGALTEGKTLLKG